MTNIVTPRVSQASANSEQLTQGISGLSSEKALEYRRAGLANDWEEESGRSIPWIVFKNLFIVFNLMIFPLLALLLAFGQYKDVLSVGGIALLNTAINIYQEIRAKLALERIRVEHPMTTAVIRDGEIREIAVREVVFEDCLLLSAGERVVGDAEIVAARHLELDESMLTGESDYVPKNVGDEVLAGSFVVAGSAVARVTRLGQKAYIQKIVSFSRKYVQRKTLLERRVDILVRVSMVLCFLVAGLLLLTYRPFENALLDPLRFIVASVTSLIPQGLVLIVTLAFALGVIAFARRGILFSRINAVESLANIDLLCMDKTGTLTENTIMLEKIIPLDAEAEADAGTRELLSVFARGLSAKNKTIEALLASCPAEGGGSGWECTDEIPFKSINKFSVVRARELRERARLCGSSAGESGDIQESGDIRESAYIDIVFGAGECIAPRFAEPGAYTRVQEASRGYENAGLRTLVLATRSLTEEDALQVLREEALTGLVPRAIVVFSETLREDAGEILAHFAQHGVRQVLISGDSLDTVQCIAKKLSLPGAELGISGAELTRLAAAVNEKAADASGQDADNVNAGGEGADSANAEQVLRDTILSCNVFARVLPEQKQTIVRTFRSAGYHVAMVGDGVNDVLALKESELSIAMGSGGSMVKDVADIVLVHNRFDALPGLLEEGEQIISRIRDCARIFTLKNSYALFLILASLIFGATFPFFPQQITMINFVTITLPLLYIVKFSRSRARVDKGFIGEILKFSLAIACVIAGASFALNAAASASYPNLALQETLGVSWLVGRFIRNPSHFVQTLSIVPIVLMASLVFLALAYRSSSEGVPRHQDPRPSRIAGRVLPLLLSLGLCLVFFASLYIPAVAGFFEFVPLRGEDYGMLAPVLIPALLLESLLLWFFLRKKKA